MSISKIYGQNLIDIQGEYIIRVKKDSDITSLKNSLVNTRSISNGKVVSFSQIMKTPMNLWLVNHRNHREDGRNFVKFLENSAGVVSVQKNRYLTIRAIPNDPDYIKQWQYKNDGTSGGVAGADIDIERAWDISTGGNSPLGDTIVICVIDDGINAQHPDIVENIWSNSYEIPSNGIDDDANGYIDDFKGWNVLLNNDNVWTGANHGTPVAGVIGARGNNGKGVTGVNWKVKLMSVNYGFASEANALAAYGYAYVQRKLYNTSNGKKGAYIVATNTSWGIDDLQANEAPLWCALYDSLGSVGILNCAATTNSNSDVDLSGDMPTTCSSEFLITVTNLTRANVKLNNAGYGKKSIDLGAYGHQVFTLTRNDYGIFGGTSSATPHVTGVIGLIYATRCAVFQNIAKSDPARAALIAKDMILHGVTPNASLSGLTTTNGKLNVFHALKNIQSLCDSCSPPAGIILQPEDQAFSVSWSNDQGSAKILLRYRESGSSIWKEVENVRKGTIIEGLKHCTEYEVQTGSECGWLSQPYSYSKYIKTTGCCSVPIVLPTSTYTDHISIEWLGDSLDTYKVSYKGTSNKWLDSVINEKKFIIQGLPPCIAYTFRIQAKCQKYNNESPITPEHTISTYCGSCSSNNYCTISKKDASQEWIESFTINSITHKSGSSKEGYCDFSGIKNIVLDAGQMVDIFIKPGYSGSSFSDFFKLYLDIDQDGKWTDDEMLLKSESVRDSVIGLIKIPNKAISGYTKLRVIMSYEQFDGACDDVEFEYGEVEDYCVFINNSLCPNNAQLTVTSIEKNRVTLSNSIAQSGVKDSVKVQYRIKNGGDWKNAIGKDTVYINGLDECALYEYRFQVKCDTLQSGYAMIDTFRTACKNHVDHIETFFYLHPNPTIEFLKISTSANLFNTTYQISTISGHIIDNKIPMKDHTIGIGHLPPGPYILTIYTNDGARTRLKFIKI